MKQLVILICTISLLGACRYKTGSGDIVTEKRAVPDFTGIKVSEGIEVELTAGNPGEVVIEADDNVIQYIRTSVKNGILRIGISDNTSIHSATLKAYVKAPEICSIAVSSAAVLKGMNVLKCPGRMTLDASSGSQIIAVVDAPDIDGEASSGSNLDLKGSTQNLDVSASSGSTVKAAGLMSEQAKVASSSGASVSVFASIALKAKASSGGSIRYKGEPALAKEESSGGSVSKD